MKKILSILILLCWSNLSFAALNLELTKGIRGQIPVAIMPFAWDGATKNPPLHLAQVVREDLMHSGRFLIANNSTFTQLPQQYDHLKLNYWRQQKVNAILLGSLQSQGGGQYQVSITLVNIYKNNQQADELPSSPILMQKTFTITKKQLRETAHKISNTVYQQLTGLPGFFASKIAFILVKHPGQVGQSYSLDTADYDGFNVKTIVTSAQPIMSPTWSPNGNSLAFVSFESGQPAIYSINMTSMNRQQLTSFPGINGAPAYSPDEKQMAVVLSKDGNPDIYLLNLLTGKLTQLTTGWSADTKPAWLPNGQSLFFTSDRKGSPQIYRLNLATRAIKAITSSGTYNADAAVAPNGQSIAFMTKKGGAFKIAVKNLQTGEQDILTSGIDSNSPSYSPNGDLILYATMLNGKSILAEVSANGTINFVLPSLPGDMVQPVWR